MSRIIEFAVTAVVLTTTVPATRVALHTLPFVPSVIFSLFPAVPSVRFQ